jgi:membrane protein implicated in regulation of membrane protease activity
MGSSARPSGDRPPEDRVWPRYVAHQVPGWIAVAAAAALASHLDWIAPIWVAGLVAIVVAKDALMYRWMRVAYLPATLHGPESLLARPVRVERTLEPVGRVRVGPEVWRARCETASDPIEAGEWVVVREVRGLELVVDRAPEGAPSAPDV